MSWEFVCGKIVPDTNGYSIIYWGRSKWLGLSILLYLPMYTKKIVRLIRNCHLYLSLRVLKITHKYFAVGLSEENKHRCLVFIYPLNEYSATYIQRSKSVYFNNNFCARAFKKMDKCIFESSLNNTFSKVLFYFEIIFDEKSLVWNLYMSRDLWIAFN